ncbi:MAG: pilus assembly protein PilM [Deltaproteobacteria bacterium]|jgi:type IV pilus assembly protein PilM|nr:pilus assembly protein PilM [Deltaproteobacteria bacterium]
MSVIGFDIGTHSAKAVLLNIKGKGRNLSVSLEGLGLAQMPQGIMSQWEEQPIPARRAMSVAMASLVKLAKLKRGRFAAMSLSGDTMIIKKINMPITSQKELRASLAMEAEQYIPYPINEVIIDGHILSTDDQRGQMSVLLVAARKEVVTNYIQAVTMTKILKPNVIDVDALALFNAYDFVNPDSRQNAILVDLGASLMHVTVLQEGMPYTIKEENIGCQRITEEFEDVFGVSQDEAEAIKLGALAAPNPTEAAEVVERVASNWVAALDRAVDNIKQENPDYQVKKIYLAGGGAFIKGLPEHFSRNFKTEAEVFNPFRSIKVNPKKFDQAYLDYIGPQMAVSFGLAIRKEEIR